jgi:hypothetical protein
MGILLSAALRLISMTNDVFFLSNDRAQRQGKRIPDFCCAAGGGFLPRRIFAEGLSPFSAAGAGPGPFRPGRAACGSRTCRRR